MERNEVEEVKGLPGPEVGALVIKRRVRRTFPHLLTACCDAAQVEYIICVVTLETGKYTR